MAYHIVHLQCALCIVYNTYGRHKFKLEKVNYG